MDWRDLPYSREDIMCLGLDFLKSCTDEDRARAAHKICVQRKAREERYDQHIISGESSFNLDNPILKLIKGGSDDT